MNWYKINIISFMLLFSSAVYGHDFHMSYGELIVSPDGLKGKITFYKNDFMKALKEWNNGTLNNINSGEYEILKKDYLSNHFSVEINLNKKLRLSVEGNEEDESSIWFFINFKSDEKISSAKIKCSILFKEFDDQMNIINIKLPDDEISCVFKKSDPEKMVKL